MIIPVDSTKPADTISIKLSGFNPLIDRLMADENRYRLTISSCEEDHPYFSCIVRDTSGEIKMIAYGATLPESVNQMIQSYAGGFPDKPNLLERPCQAIPTGIRYSRLEEQILNRGGCLDALSDFTGQITITVRLGHNHGSCSGTMSQVSSRHDSNFLEAYERVFEDIEQYRSEAMQPA